MAGKTAILAIRVLSDARGGKKGLDDTGKSVEQLQGKLSKAGDIAVKSAAVTEAAVLALAVSAGRAAAEAEQSAGAAAAAFGQHVDAINAAAEAAPRSVGISTRAYQQLAAVFGSQLRNMGVSGDRLAGQTTDLIALGADLSAMYGGTATEAIEAISSLLRGERDPIERYGVSIKQASLDAWEAAHGLDGLTGAAKTQADTQATLALLLDQTSTAQGTFARETDTASGAMQIAAAEWENAQAQLGEALLPIMVDGARIVADFSGELAEHRDLVVPLVGFLGGLAAAVLLVKGAVELWQAATVTYTAVQWALNVAMNANPIGLVITAIGLLIGLVIVIVANWDQLSAAVQDFGAGVAEWLQPAIDAVSGFIGWVWEGVQAVGALFGSAPGDMFSDPGMLGMHVGVDYSMPPTALADSLTIGQFDEAGRPAIFGRAGAGGPQLREGDTYNVNITGALDPVAVGRQVDHAIGRYRRTTGAAPAAGGRWA